MDIYKKRSLFEIIFDSCSSGKNVLKGLELLSQEAHRGPIFDGCYFLIPLQVGIETKRKIFIEFLETELANFDKNGAFHEFYRRNEGKVTFMETDISQAYKFYFTVKALKIIEETSLREKVFTEALRFIEKYYPERKASYPYERIREDFQTIKTQLETSYHFCKREIETVQKRIEIQDRLKGFDDKYIVEDFKNAEKLKLSRAFQKILKALPESTKFILQAIYTSVITSNTLKNDEEFTIYRTDKGEEAIENFLLSKRRITNKGLVTLVISEDVGARRKIQDLRRRSNNTIFVLSSYGLAFALKELGLIEELNEIVDNSILENIASKKRDNRRKEKKGRTLNDQDVREPEIEEKWAHRLVEVINRGYWKTNQPHTDEDLKLIEFERQKRLKTKQTLKEQISRIQQNQSIQKQQISFNKPTETKNHESKNVKTNQSSQNLNKKLIYRNLQSELIEEERKAVALELELERKAREYNFKISNRFVNVNKASASESAQDVPLV